MSLKKFGEFESTRNEANNSGQVNDPKKLSDGRVVLDTRWFTSVGDNITDGGNRNTDGTIGIIAVHNTKEDTWSAYIGIANNNGEDEDSAEIPNYGAVMLEKEAKGIFPQIKLKYKYKKTFR